MQEYAKTNVPAIISLILSILSVLCCWVWYISLIFGIVAVVLGILGVRSDNPRQKDAAIAGIVVGAVGFALAMSVAIMRILVLSGVSNSVAAIAVFGPGSLV